MVPRNGGLLRPGRCCYYKITRPLPSIPEWVTLEHQAAQILTKQETHGWYLMKERWELESAFTTEPDLTEL